jgi:hypothetical protein
MMPALSFLLLAIGAALADEAPKISEARKGADGLLRHDVECEFQKETTGIMVLLPDRLEKGRRYPVVYVLPVEPKTESRYGNGLLEVKKLDLHNKHSLIFVEPTFAQLPWYADHPTDKGVRQESYFLKVVVPFVEKQYPASTEVKDRRLLGFSKSGWGAFCLLLRHPDVFGKAVAFDAPMNMDRPQFGMADIVGTPEQFEVYRVPKLLEQKAEALQKGPRLGLVGYANFRDHHQAAHKLMDRLKIPHDYHDDRKPRHTWDADWLSDAVEFLVKPE